MVDEFQDTNRLQLDVLEGLERGNLFAVGDEAQSIYGFRHADVGIFRARRAALGTGRVRGLTVNFRSRPEILDVVNAAFAPVLGGGFTRLVSGRAPEELRLFAPDPPEEPRVELLAVETAGWEEREPELGLAALATQPWRRAEARAVAARLRAEIDAGRPQRDTVVLVRATSSLRLYEQALEEQGLSTYVVGGRGYWGAGAGPRRPRVPRAARQPARGGGAVRRAGVAVLRRGDRRPDPARRGGPARGRRRLERAPARGRGARAGVRRRQRRAASAVHLARRPVRRRRGPAARVRPLRGGRAAARGAAPRRAAAGARDRRHRLRPRDPRPRPAATGGSRTCAS